MYRFVFLFENCDVVVVVVRVRSASKIVEIQICLLNIVLLLMHETAEIVRLTARNEQLKEELKKSENHCKAADKEIKRRGDIRDSMQSKLETTEADANRLKGEVEAYLYCYFLNTSV